ncbi:MAG: hypothetical protein KAI47_06805 [Deltaproteobacteria bacterium]|nr:hypothetical protein [Deltaproteobacteria bacterium]
MPKPESFDELLDATRALLAEGEGSSDLWTANAHINDALLQRPKAGDAWILKSQVLSSLGDDFASLAAAAMAVQTLEDNSEALYVRATVLADLERHEEALADINSALNTIGTDAWLLEDIYFERGMMLDALGRTEDAMASFEEGISHFPDSVLLKSAIEPLHRERRRHRFRVIDGGHA